MSSTNLIRRSGLAIVLGGISIVLYRLVVSSVGGTRAGAAAVLTSTWVIGQSLHFIGGLLVLFGVVGLYARLKDSTGRLGLIGFIVAFIGTAMFVGAGMAQAYILPSIVERLPSFIDRTGPWFSGPILVMFAASDLSLLFGYLLLAIAIIRARQLPRWAAVTVMIGAILGNLPPLPFIPSIVGIVGDVLFGGGLAWLGYALWSQKGESAGKPAM